MLDRYKHFTVLILKIHRNIQKIKTEEMQEFGLKSSHGSCLYYLYMETQLTVTELCDISGEDKSYISHSLKHLEENGFVLCQSNAAKRYNAPFTLTDRGREVGARIAEKIDRVLAPAGDGLGDEERTVLYGSLSKINRNLESICQRYGAS